MSRDSKKAYIPGQGLVAYDPNLHAYDDVFNRYTLKELLHKSKSVYSKVLLQKDGNSKKTLANYSTDRYFARCVLENGDGGHFVTAKAARESGFLEDARGIFYQNMDLLRSNGKTGVLEYKSNVHEIKSVSKDPNLDRKYGLESITYLIPEGKRYTFGVEIETSKGYVPPHSYLDLNMKCVRDGSISGGEYVSGVLTGDSGFKQLRSICREISSRCRIDNKCGRMNATL